MGTRVQLQRLMAAMGSASLASIVFTVTNVKAGNFSVKATVVDSAAASYDVCDASGKVRAFGSVDDFVKSAAKYGVINGASAISYTFANVSALEPLPFTGDMTKKAQTTLASLTKQETAANAEVTNLQAQIALFGPNLTAGEQAVKTERQTQLACVQALVTWIGAEKTRINAILTP